MDGPGQEAFSEDFPEFGSPRCERVTVDLLNVRTGEVIPGKCRATFCEHCGPVEAWWKSRIIADGGRTGPPERYIVLTMAPKSWPQLRQKMRDLRRWGVQQFGAWEHAWTVEAGAKTGMRHVNVLQKGTYVPQAQLQERWGAIVHVEAIHGVAGVAGYALKEARKVAGYALKDAHGGLHEHRALNGGRLVHLSRGYLGGERQAEVRKRLASERQEEECEWVVIPRSRR